MDGGGRSFPHQPVADGLERFGHCVSAASFCFLGCCSGVLRRCYLPWNEVRMPFVPPEVAAPCVPSTKWTLAIIPNSIFRR